MKAPRIALALLCVSALAACADSSITDATPAATTKPGFSVGGIGMGSGGVMQNDSTGSRIFNATNEAVPSTKEGSGIGMGSGG